MPEIAAVILAAGSGSRMGCAKQLLKIAGQSLVRRTVQAAIGAGFDPVIVVTGADSGAVAGELTDLDVVTAFNRSWKNGIGSSIRCGISALLAKRPAVDAAAVLLCDQPRLSTEILSRLITAFTNSGKRAAGCEYGGTVGPPCCFGRSVFSELSAIPDADGAKRVLLADPSRLTMIPWPEGTDDIDTPSDWERLTGGDQR
jgi:molybdenum cofactor cytidylyltransferase